MADNEDDWVRKRAYSLWEEDGYPAGKELEHWERARREFESFSPDRMKRAKSRRPASNPQTEASGSEAPTPSTGRKAPRSKKTSGS